MHECSCGSRNLRRRVTVAPNSNTLTPCNDRDVEPLGDGPRRFLRRDEFTGPSRQRSGRRRTQSSRGSVTVALEPNCEYALIVANGSVLVDGTVVQPGALAYLGAGRDECRFDSNAPSRAMLIGGVPFDERLFMWWNFVARSKTRSPTRGAPGLRVTIVLVVSPRRSRASK